MAADVRGAWPDNVAAAALGCRARPTLAGKLVTAWRDGHGLDQLLGGITTGGIPTVRTPVPTFRCLGETLAVPCRRAVRERHVFFADV
jgi:hypothetical protein